MLLYENKMSKIIFRSLTAALLLPLFLASGCKSQKETAENVNIPPALQIPVGNNENAGDDAAINTIPEELELPPPGADLPVTYFREIWAYLVAGREQALDPKFPITDLVYFGADVDSYGKLTDIPNFKNIQHFKGRKHFVAACSSRSLTHFVLKEGSDERKALVNDLLAATAPYDGLQIDFEYVPAKDGEVFLSFLAELRTGMGNKVFSVALPARTKPLKDDVYDYEKIKPLADRILVMAYDEHWSTSKPGPIASMGWCQLVARHSLDVLGNEKLIMGLPFYGRSWGSINANKAYIHSTIEEIKAEQNITEIERVNGIPTFSYDTVLSVTVFYEDDYSLSARLNMYRKMGVRAAGFWRLGQETRAFWPLIGLENR